MYCQPDYFSALVSVKNKCLKNNLEKEATNTSWDIYCIILVQCHPWKRGRSSQGWCRIRCSKCSAWLQGHVHAHAQQQVEAVDEGVDVHGRKLLLSRPRDATFRLLWQCHKERRMESLFNTVTILLATVHFQVKNSSIREMHVVKGSLMSDAIWTKASF